MFSFKTLLFSVSASVVASLAAVVLLPTLSSPPAANDSAEVQWLRQELRSAQARMTALDGKQIALESRMTALDGKQIALESRIKGTSETYLTALNQFTERVGTMIREAKIPVPPGRGSSRPTAVPRGKK